MSRDVCSYLHNISYYAQQTFLQLSIYIKSHVFPARGARNVLLLQPHRTQSKQARDLLSMADFLRTRLPLFPTSSLPLALLALLPPPF